MKCTPSPQSQRLTTEPSADFDLWPTQGEARVSDADILDDMIRTALTTIGEPDKAVEIVYKAFVEASKESEAWNKYYFATVAALLLIAVGAIDELKYFDLKISKLFLAPVALVAFSTCTAAYTNYRLKIRLYERFFQAYLARSDGSCRAAILLQYPLAFYGFEFYPLAARPKGFIIDARQMASLSMVGVCTWLGWAVATMGLMVLVLYTAWTVYELTASPLNSFIKTATFGPLFASLTFSSVLLRDLRKPRKYEWAPNAGDPRA